MYSIESLEVFLDRLVYYDVCFSCCKFKWINLLQTVGKYKKSSPAVGNMHGSRSEIFRTCKKHRFLTFNVQRKLSKRYIIKKLCSLSVLYYKNILYRPNASMLIGHEFKVGINFWTPVT